MTRNEMFAEFSKIEDEIQARYNVKESELLSRIERLESEVLSRDLSIAALKKENGLIWQTYIERVAELEIEIKKLHDRYRAVLDHEIATKKSNTE